MLENKWAIAALAILCWAIAASFTTGYYYYQHNDLLSRMRGTLITVDLGIDYGNNTIIWLNDTECLTGMSLFDMTRHVVNVTHSVDPIWGIFIESINGVENSYPYYWIWWKWNGTTWSEGEVGADSYIVMNREILLWYYEDTSISPLPTPP